MKQGGSACVFFFLCACLFACHSTEVPNQTTPATLRIGVLPDQNSKQLQARYASLLNYLSEELGVPCELVVPADYSGLAELFHAGEVDLAHFGGFTFVQARLQSNAVPLVMRDVDTRFTSYFLVRGDNPARTLSEFQGKSFSFGSELSTSGHLMPRYFLQEQNINPETFFAEVRYSGAHDLTALWVKDGVVDLGVASFMIVDQMRASGRLAQGDVRVLWETPPYPGYVWALRPGFSKATEIKIRDAFLALLPENEMQAKILESIGAGHFLPASISDFSELQTVLAELALLNQELE